MIPDPVARPVGEVVIRVDGMTLGTLSAEAIVARVAAFCREDSNVKRMYIGIASGDDPEVAVWSRYDDYKMDSGINEFIVLHEASSKDDAREIESRLVEHFVDHKRNINRAPGGGGRTGDAPRHFVYLALRRWG